MSTQDNPRKHKADGVEANEAIRKKAKSDPCQTDTVEKEATLVDHGLPVRPNPPFICSAPLAIADPLGSQLLAKARQSALSVGPGQGHDSFATKSHAESSNSKHRALSSALSLFSHSKRSKSSTAMALPHAPLHESREAGQDDLPMMTRNPLQKPYPRFKPVDTIQRSEGGEKICASSASRNQSTHNIICSCIPSLDPRGQQYLQ